MSQILLAHVPDAEERAALVAEKLRALNFDVLPQSVEASGVLQRRKSEAAINTASCVLVLWSRDAARDASLLAIAQRARAAGKLAAARIDRAPAPIAAQTADLSAWLGRTDTRAWKRLTGRVCALAQPVARKAAKHQKIQKERGSGTSAPVMVFGFLAVFSALCAGAYYLLPSH